MTTLFDTITPKLRLRQIWARLGATPGLPGSLPGPLHIAEKSDSAVPRRRFLF
jgi:hypothetical protein